MGGRRAITGQVSECLEKAVPVDFRVVDRELLEVPERDREAVGLLGSEKVVAVATLHLELLEAQIT
jgi:hypothetical protein